MNWRCSPAVRGSLLNRSKKLQIETGKQWTEWPCTGRMRSKKQELTRGTTSSNYCKHGVTTADTINCQLTSISDVGQRIQKTAWLDGGALPRWGQRWRWAAGRRPLQWPLQWCGCLTPSRTLSPMLRPRSAAAQPAESRKWTRGSSHVLHQKCHKETSSNCLGVNYLNFWPSNHVKCIFILCWITVWRM